MSSIESLLGPTSSDVTFVRKKLLKSATWPKKSTWKCKQLQKPIWSDNSWLLKVTGHPQRMSNGDSNVKRSEAVKKSTLRASKVVTRHLAVWRGKKFDLHRRSSESLIMNVMNIHLHVIQRLNAKQKRGKKWLWWPVCGHVTCHLDRYWLGFQTGLVVIGVINVKITHVKQQASFQLIYLNFQPALFN